MSKIRPAVAKELDAIIALDEESVAALSPLTFERLSRLHSQAARHCVVEYDLDPPNLSSQRFHARFGFAEVGRQQVAGGRKHDSLQAARVPVSADPGQSASR